MIALDIPLFAWLIVAFTMLALIVTRFCIHNYKKMHTSTKIKIFGIGQESEELFVPGDHTITDNDYSDDAID